MGAFTRKHTLLSNKAMENLPEELRHEAEWMAFEIAIHHSLPKNYAECVGILIRLSRPEIFGEGPVTPRGI